MPGIEILIGIALMVATIALYSLLRRERLRGPTSTTHPFLVGVYRGCAFVLVLFVAWALLGPFVLQLIFGPWDGR